MWLDAFFREEIGAATPGTIALLAKRLRQAGAVNVAISLPGPIYERFVPQRKPPMFVLLDDQKTTLHVSGGKDAAGNPASFLDANGNPIPLATLFPTPPVWACDHPEIVAITPAPDGLSCAAVTTGTLPAGTDPTVASATVSVTATTAVATATIPAGTALSDSFPLFVTTDSAQGLNLVADPATSRL